MNAEELNKLRQVSDKKYIVYLDSLNNTKYLEVLDDSCYWRKTKKEATRLSPEDCNKYYKELMRWGYNPNKITFE